MPRFIQRLQQKRTFAAIDLGSNALRAVIAREENGVVEIIRNIRLPLRLGEDVFHTGEISSKKMLVTEEAFVRLFQVFVEYNVSEVRACATSAMRDARNGKLLVQRILNSTGIYLQTIQGVEEAQLIFKAVRGRVPLKKKTAILMDIGGGSTELTVVRNGDITGVQSFNVGTVRLLQYKDQQELEKSIREQLKHMLAFLKEHLRGKKPDLLVGTGGNLRRIGKIRKKILGRETSELATWEEIHHMQEAILSMSYIERIRRLELDQNRADVILPAIMLTHHLMEKLKLGKIHLPKVGLKEGIILSMLDAPPKKFILKD
jgi:exopolyphosphatase/guanosine-5'-triphosphate,3'-diphosphate pyrophosphatase